MSKRGRSAGQLLACVLVLLALSLVHVQAQEQPPELETIYKRGLQLYQAGKYSEAVPIAEEYVSVAAAKYGEQHQLYATGLGYLGVLYEALNRPSEAEHLFKRALSIKEKALGPSDVQVADTLHSLAELYRKQGQFSNAEPLYRRALNIAEKALGPEHPSVGTVLNNLAELYRAQGRYAEAETLLKRAVDKPESARLVAQPNVGSVTEDPASMLSQVNELYQAGKYADAIPIAERYAQIVEARYGKDGPEYGMALNNLGELFRVTNRLSEAEPLIRRALAVDEKALGLDHPNLAIRLHNLAKLLETTNRLAEAEPLYRRALTIMEKSAGVDDPRVGTLLNDLARLLNATNRSAEAEPLVKRAATINQKALRRGRNAQGKVQLGVEINDLTKEEADKIGLPPGRGVRVVRVVGGSPAEVAGLLANDILLALDGSDVAGVKETIAAIQTREPGTQVLLRVSRSGAERTMVAVLPADEGSPNLMLDTGGHSALIKGLALTPDGKQLVSAGDDKVIRVWDRQTGATVRTIRGQVGPGEEGRIYTIALSPDGRWLAAGGWMAPGRGVRDNEVGDIRLYDFATGNLVALLRGHLDGVNSLAFSADSKLLISGGGDSTAIVWDVADRRLVHRLWGHRQFVYAAGFTPDGMRAVTGGDDATLKLWSLNDGKEIATLTGHKGRVFRLAISAADGTIASGSVDGEIRLWDDKTGQFRRTLANTGAVGALSFSPDGKRLMACSASAPNKCHVWELATGNDIVTYTKHDNIVLAAAVSADGRLAATAGGNQSQIHIWSLETGDTKQTFVGRGTHHWAVAASTDGRRIAWGTTPNFRGYNDRGPLEIQLRLPDGTQGLSWPEKAPQAAALNWFRGRTRYGTIELTHRNGGAFGHESAILDVKKDGQTQASIERGTLDGYYHVSYSFSPDGRTIISASSNGVLTAFDLYGRRLGEFVGHEGDIWAVAPSPDGRVLVSGGADQTVRIWNLATRELIVTLFNGSDGAWVIWTPQGYYTSSPNAEGIVGWQINKGSDRAAEYVSAAQLRGHFFRPDIVERALILASATAAVAQAHGAEFLIEDLLKHKPPAFEVISPADKSHASESLVVVRLKLEPNAEPIEAIEVLVNGRQVTTPGMRNAAARLAATPTPERSIEVPLEQGENKNPYHSAQQGRPDGARFRSVS
jgi:WD40 repeat protein/tetratricopeptide (TPR) repeat protein